MISICDYFLKGESESVVRKSLTQDFRKRIRQSWHGLSFTPPKANVLEVKPVTVAISWITSMVRGANHEAGGLTSTTSALSREL